MNLFSQLHWWRTATVILGVLAVGFMGLVLLMGGQLNSWILNLIGIGLAAGTVAVALKALSVQQCIDRTEPKAGD
jgi:hypothetical protein